MANEVSHVMANIRRCEHKILSTSNKNPRARQYIATLKDDTSEWLQGTQLHTHVTNHFQNLFQTANLHNTLPPLTKTFQAMDFNLNFFKNTLIAFPSTEEIRTTLSCIHPQKAPGPNGLHAQFFQHSWGTMSRDITIFIQTIFITSRVPQDLTIIKLILIPKVPNLETVHQLRPISLCNTLYKLLSKIIVLRLKKFLPDLIHPA